MKTLICVPCMDMVHTSFMRSLLSLRPVGDVRFGITRSTLIYDARNLLADQAVKEGYDFTLWLDSDMTFEPDIMERLFARMEEGHDLVSGLYFTRRTPFRPVLFDQCRVFEKDGVQGSTLVWYDNYAEDSVFKIEACGFGGVMVRVDLLKRIKDAFGTPFSPLFALGEDLSFAIRANALGADMVCDSSIKLGHVAQIVVNENTYKEARQCSQK